MSTDSNKYLIELAPGAMRDLKKLPQKAKARVIDLIGNLAEEPRPEGVETITQHKGHYRVRTGNYRIVYTIEDTGKVVIIAAIADRKEIYELLSRRMQ